MNNMNFVKLYLITSDTPYRWYVAADSAAEAERLWDTHVELNRTSTTLAGAVNKDLILESIPTMVGERLYSS